jgi:methylenetetrahydrofolate dehydrogenase (NADP+)/methenyltetrahydrofolate cyclohydrolase
MIIADGKTIAQKILSQIKTDLNGRSVSVAAIWVGDNQAIGRFVEMKKKYANSIGIEVNIFHFGNNDSEDKIISKIKELSEEKEMSGIIVELPLLEKFDRDKILNSISKNKDIDVLSASAQENFYNNNTGLLPPSVEALELLFKEYGVDPKSKVAAVFGQSMLIGKPISHWLEQMGAKVFRIDEHTPNPKEISCQADIIVSGVGKPNLIKEDMVKEGAIVVDFGFEKLGEKVVGDVDFDSVAPKSSLITPVPGGMGPIVIAAFLKNAVQVTQDPLLK